MNKPTISVIIPCHNGARYLHEAMQSIAIQDWPFEIILIDDGSTDESRKIISGHYPFVRYHYRENVSSPAAARNMGISLASYNLIAFLDVDDTWCANKTKAQMSLFKVEHTPAVAGGLVTYHIMPESQYRAQQYSDKPVSHTLLSTLLVKKEVFNKIGLFDESLRLGEDLDWFLRLKESGLAYSVVDEPVLNYRIHEGSLTSRKTVRDLGTTDVIRKALERKRQSEK